MTWKLFRQNFKNLIQKRFLFVNENNYEGTLKDDKMIDRIDRSDQYARNNIK